LQLTRDAGVEGSPSWFPDGSALAFVSVRSGQTGVWKMPRFPGAAVLLLPDAVDPAVSPDGTRIAFVRNDSSGGLRIHVAPFTDLAHAKILTTEADGLWDHHHPAWSPDGKSICYEAFRDLWLVDPDNGRPHPLTSDHQSDREPVWSADGRFVYFSSDRGGARALWRVPVPAGRPVRLTLGTGPESQPSVNRAGSRLAYSTYAGGATMVLADRKTGRRTPWPGPRMVGFPTLDPSGRSLYYTAEHGGRVAIWVQGLDGGRPAGDPRPLCEQPGQAASLAVSPDSNWIVYYTVAGEKRDLWKVPAGGGVPSRLTDGPGRAIHPAVSPDGTTIGFVSDRDGSLRVWTMPFGGGPPTRVTSTCTTSMPTSIIATISLMSQISSPAAMRIGGLLAQSRR
jgi:Tol biopolymer transport system component